MCYDIKTNLQAQLSRANRKGDLQAIKEIKESLVPLTDLPIYHTTGFSHPKLLIYTDRSIHKPKGNGKEQEGTWVKTTPIIMQEMAPDILETLAASPNPVISFSTVRFSVNEDTNVFLRVYDYSGRMVETLYNGQVKAYQNYDVDFQRRNLMSGIYIVKLTTDKGQSYDKRIIVE